MQHSSSSKRRLINRPILLTMNAERLLVKYRNYFIGIAIILISLAISIRSKDGEVVLVLGEYPLIIFLLVLISSGFIALYVRANQEKIEILSNEIKELSEDQSQEFAPLLHGLTERQREVYEMIISGKSNKEIKAELFIEQSTLKTHINQIYRKLKIKNRSQLKSQLRN